MLASPGQLGLLGNVLPAVIMGPQTPPPTGQALIFNITTNSQYLTLVSVGGM